MSQERIPIYLDSNVIIDTYNGIDDELLGLILRSVFQGPYCYPFTSEQVDEIVTENDEKLSSNRLSFLSTISQNIYFESSMKRIGFTTSSPFQVFDTINEVSLDFDLEKNLGDILTYENELLARSEFGLSTNELNNLSPNQAIDTINSALQSYEYELNDGQIEPPKSLDEMMDYIKKTMEESFSGIWETFNSDPETQLFNIKVVSMFTMMDTLGFWPDSRSIYNKGSRYADSRHAENGKHFSMVVSRDKRFLKKTEAAYLFFDINTKTLNTDQFKQKLKSEMGT
ncbi:hypothetical protein [Rhodohalobacter sp. 8-1]|uniref:hypothetical protein n=1 Tax=Rhodohalobacter sp. 8-1 TaxID=3131972 RepID=UPI0030ED7888